MKIIKNNVNYIYEIKKSKFICFLFYVEDEINVNNILDDLRLKYSDANHICYAYIFSNKQKYDDDKEPSGTAGIPILEVLKKNDLTNILAVVVRYFGGIKLGAGGLIRAYMNSVKSAIDLCDITSYKEFIYVNIYFSYSDEGYVKSILKDEEIISKEYLDEVKYFVKIDKSNYSIIKERLSNIKIEEI